MPPQPQVSLQVALTRADDSTHFGIYVHWPFCAAKCPYCDFNAYATQQVEQTDWRRGYLKALDKAAIRTGGRNCRSVYFGGGTPSLMSAETVAAIIDRIAEHWNLAASAEITLEANPSSSSLESFTLFQKAGINRVSIGVQSLRNADLVALGRLHDAQQGRSAVSAAQSVFGHVSIDLIYGRQHQEIDSWSRELTEALSLAPGHLSLYQLTIEPNTPFGHRLRAGRLDGLPDDSLAAQFDFTTEMICAEAGYERYEVSNFAGDSGESRHNLLYWRCADYLGVGPGAHGRLTLGNDRLATETIRDPDAWLQSAIAGKGGEEPDYLLDGPEQAVEYAMMALRLTEGMNLEFYEMLAGRPMDSDRLDLLVSEGLLNLVEGTLRTSRRGRLLLNSVIAEILS